jgi:hypothetical protein
MRRSTLLPLTALIVTAFVSAPSFARDNGTMGTGKTKDDLINDGYTCVIVTATFTECTKNGSPTYWCTGQTCEQAPARTNPRNRFPNINLNNQILSQ